jgi:hypothetical protein
MDRDNTRWNCGGKAGGVRWETIHGNCVCVCVCVRERARRGGVGYAHVHFFSFMSWVGVHTHLFSGLRVLVWGGTRRSGWFFFYRVVQNLHAGVGKRLHVRQAAHGGSACGKRIFRPHVLVEPKEPSQSSHDHLRCTVCGEMIRKGRKEGGEARNRME